VIRDGIDKGLVVALLCTAGYRQRLAMRLGSKGIRANVRDPKLDWPQALPAQLLAMGADPLAR
jgi:hypothetical protein